MRNPFRRGWTLAIKGRHSGSHTSLDSIYKFRAARDAMAKASELNSKNPDSDVVGFVAEER